jgi:hypothetical protein
MEFSFVAAFKAYTVSPRTNVFDTVRTASEQATSVFYFFPLATMRRHLQAQLFLDALRFQVNIVEFNLLINSMEKSPLAAGSHLAGQGIPCLL